VPKSKLWSVAVVSNNLSEQKYQNVDWNNSSETKVSNNWLTSRSSVPNSKFWLDSAVSTNLSKYKALCVVEPVLPAFGRGGV